MNFPGSKFDHFGSLPPPSWCVWLSSPSLLTRHLRSSDSWPRNKYRIIPFPSGFRRKQVMYNSKRRYWRRPKPGLRGIDHTWHSARIYAAQCSPACIICSVNYITATWAIDMLYQQSDFSLLQSASAPVGWYSNKSVRPFVWGKRKNIYIYILLIWGSVILWNSIHLRSSESMLHFLLTCHSWLLLIYIQLCVTYPSLFFHVIFFRYCFFLQIFYRILSGNHVLSFRNYLVLSDSISLRLLITLQKSSSACSIISVWVWVICSTRLLSTLSVNCYVLLNGPKFL